MSKKKPLPFMPFYVDDFVGGTMHLNTTQTGAYLLLLCYQWQHGTIPKDPIVRRQVCKVSETEWRTVWEVLADKFEVDDEGRPYNERLAEEREKAIRMHDRAVNNGAKGGRPKGKGKPRRNPEQKLDETQTKPREEPKPEATETTTHNPQPTAQKEEPTDQNPEPNEDSLEADKPPSKPVMTFEVIGPQKCKEWILRADFVETMTEAYPAVDILAECKKATAWITANPKNRKTPDGMRRFLNSWMARCQDAGGASPTLKRTSKRTHNRF